MSLDLKLSYNNGEMKDLLLIALLENYCINNNIDNTAIILEKLGKAGVINIKHKNNFKDKEILLSAINSIAQKSSLKLDLSISRFRREFTDIELLGIGGFGSVYKAKHMIDDKWYAIKKISLTKIDNKVFREVKNLAMLDHPNIVRYYSSWLDYDYIDDGSDTETDLVEYEEDQLVKVLCLYIQMELCDGGTLSENIFTERENKDVHNIFLQILEGIKYVHSKDIIHRDIKPANIFFKDGVAKLGDFGLSKIENSTKSDGIIVSYGKNELYTNDIGTELYASPEQLAGNPHSFESDIYSLGILYLELISRCSTNMERIMILNNARKYVYDEKKYDGWDIQFVKILTNKNQNKRPTIDDVIRMYKRK